MKAFAMRNIGIGRLTVCTWSAYACGGPKVALVSKYHEDMKVFRHLVKAHQY